VNEQQNKINKIIKYGQHTDNNLEQLIFGSYEPKISCYYSHRNSWTYRGRSSVKQNILKIKKSVSKSNDGL